MIVETVVVSCIVVPLVNGIVSKFGEKIAEKVSEKLKNINWRRKDGEIISADDFISNLNEFAGEDASLSLEENKLWEVIEDFTVKDLIKALTDSAKKEVKICHPFLSWRNVMDIINMVPPNVTLYLITRPEINETKNIRKIEGVNVSIIEGLHAKYLIVDDSIVLHFSGNFLSPVLSLESKSLLLKEEFPSQVQAEIESFEKISSKSTQII